jgi:hypothetical protein
MLKRVKHVKINCKKKIEQKGKTKKNREEEKIKNKVQYGNKPLAKNMRTK